MWQFTWRVTPPNHLCFSTQIHRITSHCVANMDNNLRRKRSTSTLANTISFTHTRGSVLDEDIRSPVSSQFQGHLLTQTTSRSNTVSGNSPFAYLNRNGSSSTINSVTHTLSNVGFTPVVPQLEAATSNMNNINNGSISNSSPTSNTSATTSPLLGQKKEGKFSRAKLFARTKTKEALTRTKTEISLDGHQSGSGNGSGSFLKHGHHSHHHNNVLSSSSSNSQFVSSGSTLYSFDPTQLDGPGKDSPLGGTPLHRSTLPQDEKEQLADSAWHTLSKTLAPLFTQAGSNGLKLRIPIEDANKIVSAWLQLRVESGVGASTLVRELTEFLKHHLHILQASLPQGLDPLQKLAMTWDVFFKSAYHYLLAVFQPLDDELIGDGRIARKNPDYWQDTANVSVKKLLLASVRDAIVLPFIEMNPVLPPVEESDRKVLVQCLGMVKSVKSAGNSATAYSQRLVEQMANVIERQV